MNVIDVASYQTVAQAGQYNAQGVIIKATQGTNYVNPRCNGQYAEAKRKGRSLGLYHYAGGGNPVSEANYFIKNIKNYVGEAMLVLDWERGQNSAYGNGKWAQQFIDQVHKLTGVWCILYTGSEGAGQCAPYLKDKAGLWIAGYPYANYPSFTPPAQSIFNSLYNTHGMNLVGWQYSSTNIDHSVFYITPAQWKAYANPKGAKPAKPSKPAPKPTPKPKPAPKPKVSWVADKQTYKLKQAIKLRTAPSTSASVIAVLPAGSTVVTDKATITGGYHWASQKRAGGKYGYLATGPAKNGLEYVTRLNTAKSAPKPRVYTVRQNENLSIIAKKLGVSVSYLVSKNGLKNGGNLIYPGEKLKY